MAYTIIIRPPEAAGWRLCPNGLSSFSWDKPPSSGATKWNGQTAQVRFKPEVTSHLPNQVMWLKKKSRKVGQEPLRARTQQGYAVKGVGMGGCRELGPCLQTTTIPNICH